jgi:hypothetical protein
MKSIVSTLALAAVVALRASAAQAGGQPEERELMTNNSHHSPKPFGGAATLAGLTLAAGVATDPGVQSSAVAISNPEISTFATGFSTPRGLKYNPNDGAVYVTEGGTGGDLVAPDTPDCPAVYNPFTPYHSGYTGRVSRIWPDGRTEVVADHLASMADAYNGLYGPADVAFIGSTVYVLIQMGGCEKGLPNDLPAVLRINPDGSTTNVANLNAWIRANPPHFVEDTDPATTDLEPDGVFNSMIAVGRYLYVVETNRNFILKVDPSNGAITKLFDMSIDNVDHNPTIIARHGDKFYVGSFDFAGPGALYVFDKDFTGWTEPYSDMDEINGMVFKGDDLYITTMFPWDNQWSANTGGLVKVKKGSGARSTVLSNYANQPSGLTVDDNGVFYISNNTNTGDLNPGEGTVLKVRL